jgi:hypothetical protein
MIIMIIIIRAQNVFSAWLTDVSHAWSHLVVNGVIAGLDDEPNISAQINHAIWEY